MNTQTTHTVVMVSPDHFQFNEETACSNAFQNHISAQENQSAALLAQQEFKKAVQTITDHGVEVIVLPSPAVKTPDAVFPNNWFSTHQLSDGQRFLILYPMLTPNRRIERQPALLMQEMQKRGFEVSSIIDLSYLEETNVALEGTGSLIFDHKHRTAYASFSSRTRKEALKEFSEKLKYPVVMFEAVDKLGQSVYHTNVVLSIGTHFAVVCLEAILDENQRREVTDSLVLAGKIVIPITLQQMQGMAANILEIKSKDGSSKIVMSTTAYNAFRDDQRETLQNFAELIIVDIPTIEKIGGGSARCMLAEIF